MFNLHRLSCLALLLLPAFAGATSTAAYSGSLDTTLKVTNTGSGKAIVGTAGGSYATAVTGRGTGLGSTGIMGTGTAKGVHASADPSGGVGVWATGATGVHGYSESGSGVGLGGMVISEAGSNKGVDAYAEGGDAAYGVYSTAAGAGSNWAGYFAGDVHVTGTLSWPSDAQFKRNVRPMTGGLEKLLALKPKIYEMKVEAFEGRVRLPGGEQYGLIAQEVENVLPELVLAVVAPPEPTLEERARGLKTGGGAPTSYKAVNYLALIPFLIEAVQEQQKVIEAQQARLTALEAAAKGAR